MVAEAASLGLDSQVRALLTGTPIERTIARIVTHAALRKVDERARAAAIYLNQAMNGEQPGS